VTTGYSSYSANSVEGTVVSRNFCSATGISPAVLSQRLRYLEAEGLVSRHAYAEVPPRVEYVLTEKGRAALPLIDQLREYGERWLNPEPPETDDLDFVESASAEA
jgi:DNA-binding HxlR family transcriptional regulator